MLAKNYAPVLVQYKIKEATVEVPSKSKRRRNPSKITQAKSHPKETLNVPKIVLAKDPVENRASKPSVEEGFQQKLMQPDAIVKEFNGDAPSGHRRKSCQLHGRRRIFPSTNGPILNYNETSEASYKRWEIGAVLDDLNLSLIAQDEAISKFRSKDKSQTRPPSATTSRGNRDSTGPIVRSRTAPNTSGPILNSPTRQNIQNFGPHDSHLLNPYLEKWNKGTTPDDPDDLVRIFPVKDRSREAFRREFRDYRRRSDGHVDVFDPSAVHSAMNWT